jgi:uncharacterized protein involved in response to NO
MGALAPDLVPSVAGLHALTAGAIGTMTLAVMTRATLGHTGRPLTADRATVGASNCSTSARYPGHRAVDHWVLA